MTLEPRRCSTRSALTWWRLAFALMGRRPLVWLVGAVSTCALTIALRWSPTLLFVVPATAIWAYVVVAYSVDRQLPATLKEMVNLLRPAAKRALVVSVAIALVMGIGDAVGDFFNMGDPVFDELSAVAEAKARREADAAITWVDHLELAMKPALDGVLRVGMVSLLFFGGFGVPLYVLTTTPFIVAISKGHDGLIVNWRPVVFSTALFVGLLLADGRLAPAGAILLYPFLGALLYVALRDVYFGRSDNEAEASWVRHRLAAAGRGSAGGWMAEPVASLPQANT